ncbi:hypothetical protein Dcar01_01286 [Deinococcus carri]|uniref:Uncharacterized protein n=2 Tax=Deinococcus carri TaxID=1211323 RepID=A0ABP9W7V7_9DEIO
MTLGMLRLIEEGYATYRKEGHTVELWPTTLAFDMIRRYYHSYQKPSQPDREAAECYRTMQGAFEDEEHEWLLRAWELFLASYYGHDRTLTFDSDH